MCGVTLFLNMMKSKNNLVSISCCAVTLKCHIVACTLFINGTCRRSVWCTHSWKLQDFLRIYDTCFWFAVSLLQYISFKYRPREWMYTLVSIVYSLYVICKYLMYITWTNCISFHKSCHHISSSFWSQHFGSVWLKNILVVFLLVWKCVSLWKK